MKCKNCNHNTIMYRMHEKYGPYEEYDYCEEVVKGNQFNECHCSDAKVDCKHLEKYEFINYVQKGENCRFFGYLLGGDLQPHHSMKIPFWFCPFCGDELK